VREGHLDIQLIDPYLVLKEDEKTAEYVLDQALRAEADSQSKYFPLLAYRK
jgi:hypothetical protein